MKYDFDLIVIGGGAAGLVTASGAASLGAKVALIEKNKLGGDCTWYGCVPSKALLRSAHVSSLIRRSRDFGIIPSSEVSYDTQKVMSHVRDVIKKISLREPPEELEKKGVKVLSGNPRFINSRTIDLNGTHISSKRFIVCTGSHPLVPAIEGLERIEYLTNENIFDLEKLPESLAVLGGGAIGVELSQALTRLGVKVSIIEMFDSLLIKEDPETSRIISCTLQKEDVDIHTGKKAVRISKENDVVEITLEDKNKEKTVVTAEKVLVAVGRAPNVEGLDLEKAGVKYSSKGIEVNDRLQTTARGIYAAGDVIGPYQFSHMAEYQAITALGNALFPFKQKINYDSVPWCTFTDPELAHLGLTEEEAKKKYKDIKIFRAEYSANDRAITDLEEKGLVKVVCDKKGRILGAHIAGANAGEIIHEYVLAKASGLKIDKLSSTIHIYPTLAQTIKRAADQYYMGMMQSKWFKLLSKLALKILR